MDATNLSLDSVYEIESINLAESEVKENGLTLKYADKEIILEQYRNCGKNYYKKPGISVFLKAKEYIR